jgi:hypothetical protein
MKHTVFLVGLLALTTSAVEADLRYKTTLEVRTPAAGLTAVMPPAETVMMIKADTIRIEHTHGAARSVLLIRPDGQFLLDLDAGTYQRIAAIQDILRPRSTAPTTFRRTGEWMTILGLQAERVEVAMSVPVPIAPPPGFPTVIPMTGELWVSDAYRPYARSISRTMDLSGAATSGLEGIVLRQVVRNAQFGIEIEHVVTELSEAPIAAEMFELPEGFRVIDPAARPSEP